MLAVIMSVAKNVTSVYKQWNGVLALVDYMLYTQKFLRHVYFMASC